MEANSPPRAAIELLWGTERSDADHPLSALRHVSRHVLTADLGLAREKPQQALDVARGRASHERIVMPSFPANALLSTRSSAASAECPSSTIPVLTRTSRRPSSLPLSPRSGCAAAPPPRRKRQRRDPNLQLGRLSGGPRRQVDTTHRSSTACAGCGSSPRAGTAPRAGGASGS